MGVILKNAAVKASEIDGLFVDPLSLFEQCCFTIRKCVVGPKYVKARELPLPKLVLDKLMFLELSKEIVDLL